MSERRVWIAQCLCPEMHCIMAAADEADSDADAETIRAELRGQVTDLLKLRALNSWCGICGAKSATWKYELDRTRFRTMADAAQTLARLQLGNLAAAALFGDLHKGKPN
jgi:hypothetical protein